MAPNRVNSTNSSVRSEYIGKHCKTYNSRTENKHSLDNNCRTSRKNIKYNNDEYIANDTKNTDQIDNDVKITESTAINTHSETGVINDAEYDLDVSTIKH